MNKQTVKLTKLASCAGCGAKVGAGVLAQLLDGIKVHQDPNLLVGFDKSDDASVYKVSDDLALVQTVDFFPPMVDDAYTFGKIAATNALSDVYAMGGEVKTAMNIVCFPQNWDINMLGEILRGGSEKVIEAGGVLVELMQYSGSTYQYFLRVWDYDIYIGKTQLSPNMDLSPFFSTWGSLRSGGMTDEVLKGFCQQALANRGNYYNLHEQVMEDASLCPLLFSTYSVHATRGLLTGLSPSRDNVFYYSLDKDMLSSQTFDEPAPDVTEPTETETMPPV